MTGTGDAGSTVSLKDASNNIVGTATIGTDGSWSATPSDGFGFLTPTFTDINGNAVVGAPIYYNPYVFRIHSPVDGSTVNPGVTFSGQGQPNSPVTIKDADGTVVGTTLATSDGSWSVAQSGPFLQGTHDLTVLNTTSDGTSTSTPLTVHVADAVAPDAPVVDPTDGRTVTGTAEPGSTVTVRDGAGTVLGTTVAGNDGAFTFTPDVPFADGTKLFLTATDAAGNESSATAVTVDAVAPDAPVVDPTDGRTVTGTAEPGSTVTVRDGAGTVLGTTVAGNDGAFTFTPDVPFADGTKLFLTATDAAGNESSATAVTVDAPKVEDTLTPPPADEAVSDLAQTGSDILLPVAGGIALIALGAGFFAWRLRRRTGEH